MNTLVVQQTDQEIFGMQIRTHIKSGKPLGDKVADLTHATGLNQLADAYERITGRSCGCEERRHLLNRLFP
jgi:hypothetical protein